MTSLCLYGRARVEESVLLRVESGRDADLQDRETESQSQTLHQSPQTTGEEKEYEKGRGAMSTLCFCSNEFSMCRVETLPAECTLTCSTHTTPSAAETAMKARREIADYMKSGRIERARIRVSGE